MREISIEKFPPIRMQSGDVLHVTYTDRTGKAHKFKPFNVGRDMAVDTGKIFELDDELGFKKGLAVALGEVE